MELTRKVTQLQALFGDIVLIGSGAMVARGIEREIGDVDAWLPKGSFRKAGDQGLPDNVDVTENPYVWGDLMIGDIAKAGLVTVDGVEVRCLDLASLFIMKAEAARSKDIDDLDLLAPHLTPSEIMTRVGELKQWNSADKHQSFTETVVMEIQAHYFDEPMTLDLLALANMEPQAEAFMAECMGLTKKKAGRGMSL